VLDPLILKAISLGFGLLFLLAALHKLSAMQEFGAILRDYDVLPGAVVAVMAKLIPLVEIALGCAWLLLDQVATIAIASALLLAMYTSAIAVNLSRGRVHISCGCGVAGTAEADQPLSGGLVIRNLLLAAFALIAALPASERQLGLPDYAILIASVLAVSLLYIAANQLLGNNAAIGAWRNRDD
jgi:hypothetical protein